MSKLNFDIIAKNLGISLKAVKRILGTNKLEIANSEDKISKYELGLKLEEPFINDLISGETFSKNFSLSAFYDTDKVSELVLKYKKECPVVYTWIISGTFENNKSYQENSDNSEESKLPEQITHVNIIHACRTASRIRAEYIREFV